jgi:hypothetical protein
MQTANAVYYCTKCGESKYGYALQPSTDGRDRFRLGVCQCTKPDSKGRRSSVIFSLTHVSTAKWGHGDAAVQYCEACSEMGGECSDPKPAPHSMLCYCGHNIQKR